MGSIAHEDCVIVDRGGLVENTHQVHIVVVDSTGKILYSVGNPYRATLVRSAAKPAQALGILEAIGAQAAIFDDADVALMCASHSSEDRHVSRAQSMMVKSGVKESDMRCGGHPAISPEVNRKWIKQDFVPTAIYNNCSGKHIGMLTGARAIGSDVTDYHQPSSPMQLRIRRAVEELSGLSEDEIRWSIDGCNLPAPAFSLRNLGLMYAHLAAAADATEQSPTVTGREQNVSRIFRAMAKYPEMIGGDGRFCTILMEAYEGALIGKLGADACYGVGVRASDQTRALGAEGAIGIAAKVEDGSIDIVYSVVAEVLDQLRIGTDETRDKLKAFQYAKRYNTMGVEVGQVSHHFDVRPARLPN